MNETLSRWAPPFLSVLRFVSGLVLLEHGLPKLIGVPTPLGSFQPLLVSMPGHPSLPPLFVAACIIETVCGALLIVGLLTRLAAFVASGEMAVIFWSFFVPRGGFVSALEHGDLTIILCFVYLFLVFAGAGPWSIDAAFGRAPALRPGTTSPRVGTGV
jgi:putative oxidoreductase